MSEREESIPLMVQWSFAEPASEDIKEFTAQLKTYNKETVSEMGLFSIFRLQNYFGRLMLAKDTNLEEVIIYYEFAVETPSGEWEDKRKSIEIKSETGTLSVGDLIYYIHHAAKGDLAAQDHCYLEEIFLSEEDTGEGTPVYELFLGS